MGDQKSTQLCLYIYIYIYITVKCGRSEINTTKEMSENVVQPGTLQFEHSLDWVESLVRGVHYWHICFAHCSQFERSRDSTMQSNNV